MPNLEFELEISFNAKKCWALYENLVRYLSFNKVFPDKLKDCAYLMNNQTDRVTIDDCFKQFMTPEKLSHQNTWFCNRCKQHKQAVKKI
jgi:ubiquitin carboxyl-terminal hydrolase 4/11/15